jgi:endonuclease G
MNMGKREQLDKLRRFNDWIADTDPEAAKKMAETRQRLGEEFEETFQGDDELDRSIFEESIVLRRTRPVLAIKDDEALLYFEDSQDQTIWKKRLEGAAALIKSASQGVGRIDLQRADLEWVGTGWLVHEDIIVTNRHVANVFAERKGDGFSFKTGADAEIEAMIDFKQEIDSEKHRIFRIIRPLYIHSSGPDVAFFLVQRETNSDKLAQPLRLSAKPMETQNAAVIGYPAYDSRIPEPDLMKRIFGDTFNKKRLAPGAVTRVDGDRLLHNCTTLGGNSGSYLMELDTGEAIGLHFSGSFLTTNYAVRSDTVKNLLDKVRTGAVGFTGGGAWNADSTPRRDAPDSGGCGHQSGVDNTPTPGPASASLRRSFLESPVRIHMAKPQTFRDHFLSIGCGRLHLTEQVGRERGDYRAGRFLHAGRERYIGAAREAPRRNSGRRRGAGGHSENLRKPGDAVSGSTHRRR